MKYIRTKDGRIIKITGVDYLNELPIRFSHCDIDFVELFNKEDVLKVADTIKELCDEFVYRHIVCPKTDWFVNCANPLEIYGAIWTDKGLIYVAKMNDKGELELL